MVASPSLTRRVTNKATIDDRPAAGVAMVHVDHVLTQGEVIGQVFVAQHGAGANVTLGERDLENVTFAERKATTKSENINLRDR